MARLCAAGALFGGGLGRSRGRCRLRRTRLGLVGVRRSNPELLELRLQFLPAPTADLAERFADALARPHPRFELFLGKAAHEKDRARSKSLRRVAGEREQAALRDMRVLLFAELVLKTTQRTEHSIRGSAVDRRD